MARKNNARTSARSLAADVVPESIENPAIDFHNQMPNWQMTPSIDTPVNALDEFGPILEEEDEALLDLIEAQAANLENLDEEVSASPAYDQINWKLKVATFDDAEVDLKARAIALAIDDRGGFERTQNPDNENIHKTLKKVHAAFFTKAAARVMLATNTSEDFINRSVHEGKRYNVYALGKIADLMKAATDGVMSNAINIACMKSLFAMQAAGKPFTLETAKACASKQYGCDAAIRQHLIRHTVAPGTAPTQASSTMQAMVTLGIVATSGSAKNPTYTLTKNPIVDRMFEVLAA